MGYFDEPKAITQMQRGILKKFAEGVLSTPSANQYKVLYGLYSKALDEGVVFK